MDTDLISSSSSSEDSDEDEHDPFPREGVKSGLVRNHNNNRPRNNNNNNRKKGDGVAQMRLEEVMNQSEMLNVAQSIRERQVRQQLLEEEEELRTVRAEKWRGIKERLSTRNGDAMSSRKGVSFTVGEFGEAVYDEWELEDYRFRKSIRNNPDLDYTQEENHYLYTVYPSARNEEATTAAESREDDESALLAVNDGDDRELKKLMKTEKLPWSVKLWHKVYNWTMFCVYAIANMPAGNDPSSYYQPKRYN